MYFTLMRIVPFPGFVVVWVGDACECDCHELRPGTRYPVRAQAVSAGGEGSWSKVNTVFTDPVAPPQCAPPTLGNRPKAHTMQLKWGQYPLASVLVCMFITQHCYFIKCLMYLIRYL